MGKKKKKKNKLPKGTPAQVVRKLMKAGKVKKKCCRSAERCKKCPVLALKRIKDDFRKVA
ncbi:MAG TPA: hypothetical protein VFV67_15675 [Actinophytocola sp.]|uniref:hypothetical protein n=1 Tax=Actinophytocola sp. TaxID=1872138 RepID=UPI002DB76C32|nr:hypothetical protein [Actinophytocola sp.]HEU5472092.1 hypothetical protein [Actinophytocola sp.]